MLLNVLRDNIEIHHAISVGKKCDEDCPYNRVDSFSRVGRFKLDHQNQGHCIGNERSTQSLDFTRILNP